MPQTFPPIYHDPNRDKPNYNPKKPNAEKLVYDALQLLGDEFYVFHSYKWQGSYNSRFKYGENDFMVYHPNLGILIFEVKGGKIEYRNNEWVRVHKNNEIEHIDPRSQVLQSRGTLLNVLKEQLSVKYVTVPVKVALWFPNSNYELLPSNLPVEASNIFDQKTLKNPERAIREIFSEEKENDIPHKKLLGALMPALNIVSSYKIEQESVEQKMLMLTRNQSSVLDFTEYQPFTAIRGGAGTGKTVIAEEKVRRIRMKYPDDQVLFLCFNRALKDVLEKRFEDDNNVNAINYDSLTVQMADEEFLAKNYGNFKALQDHFYDKVLGMDVFPYPHIVIDEAQDFEEDWIELLASTHPKSFYLFYDRNQDIFHRESIQAQWISDIDCRLSLNVNCRNTKEIAHFANSHLKGNKYVSKELILKDIESGKKPHIVFYEDLNSIRQFIGEKIADWNSESIDISSNAKIVSLFSSRDKNNQAKSISGELSKHKKYYVTQSHKGEIKIPLISASRIKGLESNYVFLIDVELARYTEEAYLRRLYVAASRAKHELYVFVKHTEKEVVKNALKSIGVDDLNGATTYKQLLNRYARILECSYDLNINRTQENLKTIS